MFHQDTHSTRGWRLWFGLVWYRALYFIPGKVGGFGKGGHLHGVSKDPWNTGDQVIIRNDMVITSAF